MPPMPTKLAKTDEGGLVIDWSDGQQRRYRAGELREACPCATCREKRSAPPPPLTQLPILSAEEARPTRIESMKPMGNYAYGIAFSDGHSSGLFPLEMLYALGEVVASD